MRNDRTVRIVSREDERQPLVSLPVLGATVHDVEIDAVALADVAAAAARTSGIVTRCVRQSRR